MPPAGDIPIPSPRRAKADDRVPEPERAPTPESADAGDRPWIPEPRPGRPDPAESVRPETAREDEAREGGAREGGAREHARRPEPARSGPARPESGTAADETPRTGVDRPHLGEYRTELVRRVQPVVERDVSLLAAELRRESGAPVDVSVRAATAESLAERAAVIGQREGRTAAGTDMPDALGARITVADPGQLTALVDRVRQRYAGGPSGRILTIDEDAPRGVTGGAPEDRPGPGVRVTVGTESSGRPYSFTLWLAARGTTRDVTRAGTDWFRPDAPGPREDPSPPPEDRHA